MLPNKKLNKKLNKILFRFIKKYLGKQKFHLVFFFKLNNSIQFNLFAVKFDTKDLQLCIIILQGSTPSTFIHYIIEYILWLI